VQLHGRAIAEGQDQTGALAFLRADSAEDVGRFGSLVERRSRACAAPRPAPGDLVLLPDPRLILPPQLYRGAGRQARRDFF